MDWFIWQITCEYREQEWPMYGTLRYTNTDQRIFMWLYGFKEPDSMLARWLKNLGQFQIEIKHEAGKKAPHANCLSKVPTITDVVINKSVLGFNFNNFLKSLPIIYKCKPRFFVQKHPLKIQMQAQVFFAQKHPSKHKSLKPSNFSNATNSQFLRR